MNPCIFVIFSLLLPLFVTTTASQLGGGGDDTNDVMKKKCLDKERDALLLIKASLYDPSDTLSTWTPDDHDCCNWNGVMCSKQTGHVTRLDISLGDLEGEISPSLLNLTYLNLLDLSGNSFHGTIPTFIGSLTRLIYLNLGQNKLNGTIPRSIGSLKNLTYLYLSDNSFYGTIPPELGNLTNLQYLDLSNVGMCRVENIEWLSHLSLLEWLTMDGISLAKANEWVDVILSLRKLSYLSLGGCELSQVMYPYSSSFLNSSSSSSSIESLHLGNNNLNSSMYRWLRLLASNKLHQLHLSGNMLDGIPKYLGSLCTLEYLFFYNNSVVVKLPDFLNNLSGCTSLSLQSLVAYNSQFTGSLSDEIQKFSSLHSLYLSHSHLNGSISEKLWELPRLQTLDVSFNDLRVPLTYHLSGLSYVKDIDLCSCKLGPGFPKWIHTLKNLTRLDLSNNGISDTIPLEFWDMSSSQLHYLNLSSNNISGEVPDLSSNFDNESVIDLSSNSFYGPIPNLPSTLSSLNLSRNKFSGGISFICQFVDGLLEFLDLSHNSFIGQLPNCLWHFKELKVLSLGHNNLFGRLPPSIGSLIQLDVLYLYNNNFSGELPLSLTNCTSLISLNLGANKFSGNVPVWIGENLSKLYVLILRSNNFFGTIPLHLCQLANLQLLDLSMNNLHGAIPSCLSNLTSMVQQGFLQDVDYYRDVGNYASDHQIYVDHAMIEWQGYEREFFSTLKLVKSIDLSSNNLTGQIPHEITSLHDLISMNLSKNVLSGEIPQKIGEMKNLLTLDLSRNNFSGRIPSSMSQMSLLNDLDVSFNNLSGRIPSSTQLQSFPPSTYSGNARLCGPPLTKKCPGEEESKVPPLIGKGEGKEEDIDELEKWFYIGGGMGFATGFWIACGSLLLNRRW
ncbi:receptor-like protein EIX2 [Lactuca sativa]|uniref:receptor-like protein EIX2 n=1 Tax=Lactuca sativa TaxID=4236 RepID=UPI000CC31D99|nr:receptor-like protein EIX2 [Lactuca sativa]